MPSHEKLPWRGKGGQRRRVREGDTWTVHAVSGKALPEALSPSVRCQEPAVLADNTKPHPSLLQN